MGKRLPIRRVAQAVLLLAAVGTMYRAADFPTPGIAIPFLSGSGDGAARLRADLVSARALKAPGNPQAFAAHLYREPAQRIERSPKAAPAVRATIRRRRSPAPRSAPTRHGPPTSPALADVASPAVRPPSAEPSDAETRRDAQPEPAAKPEPAATPPVPVQDVASVPLPIPPAPAAPPETPALPLPPLPEPPPVPQLPAVPQAPPVPPAPVLP